MSETSAANRKKGPKNLPRLPLSAFSPPNTGTGENFPLPPSPSTVHPDTIVDANLIVPDVGLDKWVSEAGVGFGSRVSGVVALVKKDQDQTKFIAEIPSGSKLSVLSVAVPFVLGQPTPKLPPTETPKVSIATRFEGNSSPQSISSLKWALNQGCPVDIDVQCDLASESLWEAFQELLTKASEGVNEVPPIVLSNLLPPPHDLSLQIVKLINHPTYHSFQSQIATLSLYPSLYVKFLPPAWDEVPLSATDSPEESDDKQKKEKKRRIKMYLSPAVEAFGFSRIMFGSSSSTAAGSKLTASEWYELARESLAELGVDQEAVDAVFSQNAKKVYG